MRGAGIERQEAKNKLSSRESLQMKPQTAEASELPESRDMSNPVATSSDVSDPDRRNFVDRRKRTFYSLFYGSFNPRRRAVRRDGPPSLRDLDWHQPQWLAVAMLIVLLSCVDAALTLTLISHGAYEVNPVMAPIVGGSAFVFTIVKVGLTAGGVVLLTLAVRLRAFGRVPVSFLLCAVLAGYAALIVYELRLLEEISLTF
jgi:hypothetical protein